ncbi:MAG: hypothetical protein ABSG86_05600 [Thermoguttaceae bacterium]|jgi:hypothetical protein
MASRRIGGVWVLLLVTAWTAPAWANPIDDFCTGIVKDFKRRNCWPEPFVYPDRQAVREPFAIMVGNGWQRQNLVADGHFDSGGTELSEAGREKVLEVLNEAPEQHRIVFVARGATPPETATRLATVRRFVAQSTYGGQVVPVAESNRPGDGWPASRVDLVNRKFEAATPEPKLPGAGGGGGGGGAGSLSGAH